VAIAAGGRHSVVLTDEGAVLWFGSGLWLGLCDWKTTVSQLLPQVIAALHGRRVVAIAAGEWHSMVLTDQGAVLSFGHGEGGQLGHGDEVSQPVPKVIEALRGARVVAIAAGGNHSMVLTDDGTVLSFGAGLHGQLGHGDEEESESECWEGIKQLVPKVIEALRGVRVVAIAAGTWHSMVLTDEGEVLSFGEGENGQLGHGGGLFRNPGALKDQFIPKVIAGLSVPHSLLGTTTRVQQ